MTVGKTSFPDEQLLDNYQAIIEELIRAKPSAAKGKYLRTDRDGLDHGPRHQGRPVAHPDLVEAEAVAGRRSAPTLTPSSTRLRPPQRVRPGIGGTLEPRPEGRGHR